jgi:hypothetical protein
MQFMKSYLRTAKPSLLPLLALPVMAAMLSLMLSGCGPAAETAKGGDVQKVSAACGSCVYQMKGVEGCQTAVKIDGKTYVVTGAKTDAMSSGLCAGEKPAEVTGKIEGDKFVATSFKLVK